MLGGSWEDFTGEGHWHWIHRKLLEIAFLERGLGDRLGLELGPKLGELPPEECPCHNICSDVHAESPRGPQGSA